MVIQETMRLFPPIWALIRIAAEDDEIEGHKIKAGDKVVILAYVMHHSPKYWEEPEKFDPERFAPERSKKRVKYSYLPFAAGKRACIGGALSQIENTLALVQLLRRFTPEYAGPGAGQDPRHRDALPQRRPALPHSRQLSLTGDSWRSQTVTFGEPALARSGKTVCSEAGLESLAALSSHCCAAFSLPARNDAQGGDGSASARHLVQAIGARSAQSRPCRPTGSPRQEAVFDAVPHQLLEVRVAERVVVDRADIFMGEIDALDARDRRSTAPPARRICDRWRRDDVCR